MFCAAGVALYIAMFAVMPGSVPLTFSLFCFLFAPLVFFMGCIAYNAMKFSPKTDKAANWMQLATGALVTILFGIGAHAVYKDSGLAETIMRLGWNGNPETAYLASSIWYSRVLVSVAFIGQLIVFGLMPLLKGVSKTLFATAEDDNNIPLSPRTKKEKPAKEQPAQAAPTSVAVQPPAPTKATPKAAAPKTPTPAAPVSAATPKAAPTPRAPKPK